MKVLPMMQPWASLVVEGVKRTETRNRHTNHRGPVLILATTTVVAYEDARYAWDFLAGFRGLKLDDAPSIVEHEQRGRVVGGAHIVSSVRSFDIGWDAGVDGWLLNAPYVRVNPGQEQLGDFGPGRRVWLLDDAAKFDQAIICRGMPGMFDAPPDVEREALLQWGDRARV